MTFQKQPPPKPALPPQARRAFQSEPTTAKKKLELNIDNKQSMTETLPKPEDHSAGQKQAVEANERLNEYSERAATLAMSFKKALDDKTLPMNKSIIAKDAERSIINNFVDLGTDMNNDTREKEGMGAMGIIALLLRASLLQRDRINELEYAGEQMRIKIGKLETQIKEPIDKPKTSG
jgi:hypothetical protein